MDIKEIEACPDCGAGLSVELPGGFCARCLLSTAGGDPKVSEDEEMDMLSLDLPNLRLIESNGSGAMGTVFRARQLLLKRDVAVKVISPRLSSDPEFIERFFREAQAMAMLNHPNIVAVHEVGESRCGNLYLVMELVKGGNIKDLLREDSIGYRDTIRWLVQICHALEYAHGEGVIHRDIKPSNILVDSEGNAKLADFGIAMMEFLPETESLTATSTALGTPEYIAPEQMDDVGISDHRADIYSLGITFYEMLTGVIPRGMWQWPSKMVEGLDKRFDRVIDRALQNDPKDRFQTVSELEVELRKLLVKPKRVAAWIFVLMSVVLVSSGIYSLLNEEIENPRRSIEVEDRVLSPRADETGQFHWESEVIWGKLIPAENPEREYVARVGAHMVTDRLSAEGDDVEFSGRSLVLGVGSTLQVWGDGGTARINQLVLDGGTVTGGTRMRSSDHKGDELNRQISKVDISQSVVAGNIQVRSLSQIDTGTHGKHPVTIQSYITGGAPLYVPYASRQMEVSIQGENPEFRGGWFIRGHLAAVGENALGSGPVQVHGGKLTLATFAKLGEVEVERFGRLHIEEGAEFETLVLGGVPVPPGVYSSEELYEIHPFYVQADGEVVVRQTGESLKDIWYPDLQGGLDSLDSDAETVEFDPGAEIVDEERGSWFNPEKWKGRAPRLGRLMEGGLRVSPFHYRVGEGKILKTLSDPQGVEIFGGLSLSIEKGAELKIDGGGATLIYPRLRMNGGRVALSSKRAFASNTEIAGTIELNQDTEFVIPPRGSYKVRKNFFVRGRLEGEGDLIWKGSGNDFFVFLSDARDFKGGIVVGSGVMLSGSPTNLERSRVELREGTSFVVRIRPAPRIGHLHLSEKSTLVLEEADISVGTLLLDGVSIPPGKYGVQDPVLGAYLETAEDSGYSIIVGEE